jgi:aldehyde dehydrogenase (NAD+)
MIYEAIDVLPRYRDLLTEARTAQQEWMQRQVRERLRVVRELRYRIAEHAGAIAACIADAKERPIEEILTAEVLPLADACRWLERNAARVLASRHYGSRGRPLWMQGISFEVQRQAYGVVLVIGPGNYPLFLPAVQSIHALAAGNAVILKPAPGTLAVAQMFERLAIIAGIDRPLLTILPESVEAAHDAISAGVNKVIFTGSCANGRDLLATLAGRNIPSVMELSGEDAVIVLTDADLDLAARALRFGARLNAGRTCIAPRRLIVIDAVADHLLARLSQGDIEHLEIERVDDDLAALQRVDDGEFALGASIFTRDVARARTLAARIATGFVIVNDLIVPTADPRMPFGGTRGSGFGVTRGEEGLLEMTFPHVVAVNRLHRHPHFDQPTPEDARLFAAYINAAHGRHRWRPIRDLIAAIIDNVRTGKERS